jgi:hypothetical protein
MKKFALSLLLIAFGALTKAQNYDLKFNQVKLVSTLETVPVGKVWKIESVIYNIQKNGGGESYSIGTDVPYHCGSVDNQNYSINIDGVSTKVGPGMSGSTAGSNGGGYYYNSHSTMLPCWLPAGATLDSGPCFTAKISVIEFDLCQSECD